MKRSSKQLPTLTADDILEAVIAAHKIIRFVNMGDIADEVEAMFTAHQISATPFPPEEVIHVKLKLRMLRAAAAFDAALQAVAADALRDVKKMPETMPTVGNA